MKTTKNVPTAIRLTSSGKVVTREDILAELEDGVQRPDLAKKLGIGAETLRQLMKLFDLERRRAKVTRAIEPVFEFDKIEAVEETPEVKEEPVEAVIPELGGRKRRKRVKNRPKYTKVEARHKEVKPEIVTEDKLDVKPTARETYSNLTNEEAQRLMDEVKLAREELVNTVRSLISVSKKISQLEEINLN